MPPPGESRAWIEIDLGALVRNGATIAAGAGVPLLPMVKADAYGLGAVPAARALAVLRPWGYGVATVEEGIALRTAGIGDRILVFMAPLDAELAAVRAHGLTPALSRRESIDAWCRAGGGPWHLAIDTGMHRTGAVWHDIGALGDALRLAPPEGVFTHFHSADSADASVALQVERFAHALAAMPARPPIVHAENSAAIERGVHPSVWTVVRPGIFLYGASGGGAALQPEPVVAVRARVMELRSIDAGESVSYGATYRATSPRTIATVGVGYADGYRRAFSHVGRALVRGRRVPVAGVVTMDMTMLDVTGVPCAVGDVATLLGRASGEAQSDARAPVIDLATAAREAGLASYEVLTGLRGRLARVYGDAPHV